MNPRLICPQAHILCPWIWDPADRKLVPVVPATWVILDQVAIGQEGPTQPNDGVSPSTTPPKPKSNTSSEPLVPVVPEFWGLVERWEKLEHRISRDTLSSARNAVPCPSSRIAPEFIGKLPKATESKTLLIVPKMGSMRSTGSAARSTLRIASNRAERLRRSPRTRCIRGRDSFSRLSVRSRTIGPSTGCGNLLEVVEKVPLHDFFAFTKGL